LYREKNAKQELATEDTKSIEKKVMEQDTVERLKAWFDDYTAGFYGDDEYVSANLKMKEEHTRRTCKEILYLAGRLGLDKNQTRLSEVIALFHDIGRFEQFVKYRTYNDFRSCNHSLLGLEVLRQTKVLDSINGHQRQLIEKAIEYHGLKELSKDLDGQLLLFSELIRDADKLDIYYVVTEYYKQHRDNPEDFKLELEFPDTPGYSAEIVEAVLSQRRIDYSKLQKWNDMKLLQLGWVYDVNFPQTLKRIRQRRFLEKIIEFLPQSEDIEKVKEKVLKYVDSRIKSGR